jgi:hypothetical protein
MKGESMDDLRMQNYLTGELERIASYANLPVDDLAQAQAHLFELRKFAEQALQTRNRVILGG